MYVMLFLIPQGFEMEKLMLFLISCNSVSSMASSVVILSEDILNLSCPVLLNPQLQKMPLLWEQVSSAQAKLLHPIFTSLQWNTALLKVLTHLGVWEAETYFFYGCWCCRAGEPGPQDANSCCSVRCKEDAIPSQGHHIECMCAHLSMCLHLSDISI